MDTAALWDAFFCSALCFRHEKTENPGDGHSQNVVDGRSQFPAPRDSTSSDNSYEVQASASTNSEASMEIKPSASTNTDASTDTGGITDTRASIDTDVHGNDKTVEELSSKRNVDPSAGPVLLGSPRKTPCKPAKACTNAKDASTKDNEEDSATQQLVSIHSLALELECRCQKYPKYGRKLFSGLQDRYLAVVPAAGNLCNSSDGDSYGRDDSALELRRWRKGHLAYWENEAAYRNGGVEQGKVELLKIAKVSLNKEDRSGLTVKLKHLEKGEFFELILRFSDKSEAEQWSSKCYTLLTKVRKI